MKNQKIIEAYNRLLPAEERDRKNLEQILRRLSEEEEEAALAEDASDTGTAKREPVSHRRSRMLIAAAAVAGVILILAVFMGMGQEVYGGLFGSYRHRRVDAPATIVYEFYKDYTGVELPQVVIGWLPEDFQNVEPRIDAMNDAYTFSRFYETPEGRLVVITVDYMHKGGKIYISPEPGEELQIVELTINGNRADLYWDSWSGGIKVFDDDTGLLIQIMSNIEIIEMIKIAENITFIFNE